jgi:hypothetical protein
MTDPIKAKVARILNETDLAFNKGQQEGVEVGMKFAVLSDVGAEIKDPDSGEVLDSLPVAKTVVKIIHVANRSAIGRTFRSRKSGGFFPRFGQETTHVETLDSDETRVQQELDEQNAKVKIGDEAVEYKGDFSGIVYDF